MNRLLFAASFALLLPATSANATTLRALSADELVRQSDRVVVGTVESRESFWSGTRILTRHRLRVEESWRGESSDEIEVLTLGGVVGDLGQHVAGTARLRLGDRVLLFVANNGGEANFTVGMSQGAFHIDPEGGLTRPSEGAHLLGDPPLFPADLTGLRHLVEGVSRAP